MYLAPVIVSGALAAADTLYTAALLIGLYMILMAFELLNTAVEALCDRLTRQHCPEIGRVKDIASAAVGLMIVVNVLGWATVLWSRYRA